MALGLIAFLAEEDIGNIYEIMHNFESIFSGSYLKVSFVTEIVMYFVIGVLTMFYFFIRATVV